MKRIRIILVGVLLAALAPAADTAVFLTIEEAPRTLFPEADSVERRDVPSSEELRAGTRGLIGRGKPSYWEPFYISFVARKGADIIGYAVI